MASPLNPDKRQTPRVAFFLVPADREQLPVWLFKPEGDEQAAAGLIVNASSGGVQVLVNAESPDPPELAVMGLLLNDDPSRARYQGRVRRVWTRPFSTFGQLHGYEFTDPSSAAQEFIATFRPSLEQRSWVRCLLAAA